MSLNPRNSLISPNYPIFMKWIDFDGYGLLESGSYIIDERGEVLAHKKESSEHWYPAPISFESHEEYVIGSIKATNQPPGSNLISSTFSPKLIQGHYLVEVSREIYILRKIKKVENNPVINENLEKVLKMIEDARISA